MALRQDVFVYNESTGLVLTGSGLGGRKPFKADSAEWRRACASGTILALELAQDDCVVVRVVVADSLTAEEDAEWVDRVIARLDLPKPGLALCGGIDYVENPTSDRAAGFVQHAPVPAGVYRAEWYTYFTGPNFLEEDPAWPQPADLGEKPYVDFLLRLTTLEGEEIPSCMDEQGWIAWKPPARRPRRAPRGIAANNPLGWKTASHGGGS